MDKVTYTQWWARWKIPPSSNFTWTWSGFWSLVDSGCRIFKNLPLKLMIHVYICTGSASTERTFWFGVYRVKDPYFLQSRGIFQILTKAQFWWDYSMPYVILWCVWFHRVSKNIECQNSVFINPLNFQIM